MEKKQTLMGNALIFGALTGVTLIILSGVLNLTNNPESKARYLGYLLLGAGIVIGTLNYRDKSRGGYLSYGPCMGTGVLISVFAGVLASIYVFVYMSYINPNLVEEMLDKMRAQWETQGLNSDQIATAEKWSRRFMTPGVMTAFTVLGYAIIGTLISLVSSAFIRKDPPLFSDTLDQPQQ
ncbi:MAG: DUF4199 domain-containing protein [Bacteroidia bacterium]